MPYPIAPEATLTTGEMCARLNVTRSRVRDLEYAGILPRVGTVATIGARGIVYSAADVEVAPARWAAMQQAKADASRPPPRPPKPPPLEVPADMMSAEDVCAALNITKHTLKDYARTSRLTPALRYIDGGQQRRLFRREDVESIADARDGFTPMQRISAVADALRSGMVLPVALELCGVSSTTWKYWVRTRGDAAEAHNLKPPTQCRPHPVTLHAGRTGRVYFVSGPGKSDAIKIGWTQGEVDERVAALQCGSPVPLLVLASVRAFFAFERWCHRELAADRSYGEWFRRSAQLVAFVGRLRELGDVTGHTPDELRAMLRPEPLSLFGGTHGPTP